MIAISTLGDPQGMIPVIERIYPKASELSEILNYNPCPECGEVFHNPPNLEMHLSKYHGRESARRPPPPCPVIRQYYCPEVGCKYSGHFNKEFGIKYFTQHKYLKQHYIKVHMEKKFVCEQCGKGFATLQLRRRHLEECGVKFVCSCGAEYNTIAALLTHASRKRHTFIKSWPAVRTRKTDKNDNIGPGNSVKQSAILPKCDSMVATAAVALGDVALNCHKGVDIAVQTEPTTQRRRRNTSRQTQTGEKRTRISSETQTVGEVKKNTTRRRKKSMETQTKVAELTSTVTSEESFAVKDLWLSSATQTSTSAMFNNSEQLPTLSGTLFETETENIASNTDKSDYFPDLDDSNDKFFSSFIKNDLNVDDSKSCSIETQTEFCIESLFENFTDTFSNIETQTSHELWDTCTQTCDDILLAFSDIETQTDVYGETQNRH